MSDPSSASAPAITSEVTCDVSAPSSPTNITVITPFSSTSTISPSSMNPALPDSPPGPPIAAIATSVLPSSQGNDAISEASLPSGTDPLPLATVPPTSSSLPSPPASPKSSHHTSSFDIPPLQRGVGSSILKEDQLAALRNKFSIPPEFDLHLPSPSEHSEIPPPPYASFTLDHLKAGLHFPLHPLFSSVSDKYHLPIGQLTPTSWSGGVVITSIKGQVTAADQLLKKNDK